MEQTCFLDCTVSMSDRRENQVFCIRITRCTFLTRSTSSGRRDGILKDSMQGQPDILGSQRPLLWSDPAGTISRGLRQWICMVASHWDESAERGFSL